MSQFLNGSRLVFIFLTLFSFRQLAIANVEIVLGSVDLRKNVNLYTNSLPKTESAEIIISRSQYLLSYNKELKNPNWAAWKLEKKDFGNSGRAISFTTDDELAQYLKSQDNSLKPVAESDYKGFCFDRGHQVPSADRSNTVDNNKETFLMSNISPQTPYLNRGVWSRLEQYTRTLVHNENKKAYIIAGPIYDRDFGKIGANQDIQVPSKHFKIIFFVNANQSAADINSSTETIAVIMPNTNEDGSPPAVTSPCPLPANPLNTSGSMNDWEKYKTTITEVEQLSGITFFRH
jgi:endonuclease G, mitochondrial